MADENGERPRPLMTEDDFEAATNNIAVLRRSFGLAPLSLDEVKSLPSRVAYAFAAGAVIDNPTDEETEAIMTASGFPKLAKNAEGFYFDKAGPADDGKLKPMSNDGLVSEEERRRRGDFDESTKPTIEEVDQALAEANRLRAARGLGLLDAHDLVGWPKRVVQLFAGKIAAISSPTDEDVEALMVGNGIGENGDDVLGDDAPPAPADADIDVPEWAHAATVQWVADVIRALPDGMKEISSTEVHCIRAVAHTVSSLAKDVERMPLDKPETPEGDDYLMRQHSLNDTSQRVEQLHGLAEAAEKLGVMVDKVGGSQSSPEANAALRAVAKLITRLADATAIVEPGDAGE